MEKHNQKRKKKGLSLEVFNIALFTIALIITFVMFAAMRRTTALYDQTHDITQQVVELRQSAYDMQVASDYLTEQIRCFAVTGEKKYLENYFEEANVTKRRELALERIEAYNGNSAAVKSLNEAMVGSVDLMNIEYYAALLTIDAYGYDRSEFSEIPGNVELSGRDAGRSAEDKKQTAVNMLFDNVYRSKKEYISNNMVSCLSEISESMGKEQNDLASQLTEQVYLEHVLTELLIGIMLGIVIATTIMVVNPLMKIVGLIRDEKPIPVKGAYEVRFLAKTYNLMYYTNIESKKKLEYDASHDKLTGCFNRRGYELLLSNVDMDSSGLMLVDLDNFKQINDKNGHDVGDKVLIRLADSLVKSFRNFGYTCRLGGDEFVVILTHVDEDTGELIKKKVKKINEKLFRSAKGLPPFSISAGVAMGREGVDADLLYKRADEALYRVKESGRGDVEISFL